ncbi:MAG: sialate O-acetylesterase [Clostridia bacterium]|nr:sialate O-acetylesterase [Clostridia bacterium]
MIHSFLLIGQSNMAGRGFLSEAGSIENDKIKVLRNGRWQGAFRPINPDRSFAGVSLAESFADLYEKEHGVEVGLIPCADGGTNIDQWCVGSLLYDNAIYQARLAQRTSTIAGILWHQGESDAKEERYPLYEEKLLKIMNSLRKDLNLYDVPFLLGGLGDYLAEYNDGAVKNYVHINKALEKIAKENPMTGFVSAKGLTSNPDYLHFNTKSLLEFGTRYYEEFKRIEDKNKVFTEKGKEDDSIRSEMELL